MAKGKEINICSREACSSSVAITDTVSQFSQNVDRTILDEVGGLSPNVKDFGRSKIYTAWEEITRMYTIKSDLYYIYEILRRVPQTTSASNLVT